MAPAISKVNYANHPHPRINTVEGRARRSLIEAGLNKSKKHEAEPSIDDTLDLDCPELKFGRLLAGSDVKARHKGVLKLKQYIRSRCSMDNESGGMSELDLMKLWKGLWYCLFLADKAPVQDELSKNISELLFCFEGTEKEDEYAATLYMEITNGESSSSCVKDKDEELQCGTSCCNDGNEDVASTDESDLAELGEEVYGKFEDEDKEKASSDGESTHSKTSTEDDGEAEEEEDEELDKDAILVKHCRGAHLASAFCRTFFRTMRQNWGVTDQHRVDKFYTLMRYVLRQMYVYMANRSFNLGIVRLFNDALFEEILSMTPNGLRFHIIDISVEELAKVSKETSSSVDTDSFLSAFEPYFAMLQTEHDTIVHSRLIEHVLVRFLVDYSACSTTDNISDDLKLSGVNVKDIASFLFGIASDEESLSKHRDALYDLHKEYMRKVRSKEEMEAEAEKLREASSAKKKKKKKAQAENATTSSAPGKEAYAIGYSEAGLTEKSIDGELRGKSDSLESRSSKKNKKKSKKSSAVEKEVEKEAVVDEEDLTYTISLEEQKEFAEENIRKKKKEKKVKKRKSKKLPESVKEDEEKRVKFRKMNESKTYKASMRGLQTAEIELTKTPEKSILIRKATPGISASASKSKKKRKKRL